MGDLRPGRWEAELADPAAVAAPARLAAPRLDVLGGARLGLLYNHKPNAAALLEAIGSLLERDHGVITVKRCFTQALHSPADPGLIGELVVDVDMVLVGVGDSGSPSLLTVHDALEVELHGVPAICVVTEPFGPGDAAMARMRGAPSLGIAVVPHPVAGLDDGGLRARAERALPQVVALATGVSGVAASGAGR